MHALRYTYIDLSISTGYSTTEINLTELLSKFLHILFKQIPFIYLKMMYFKVNSSMIPRDVEGTRIKRKEKSKKANGSSDFSNRLPNERKNHSDAWRFSYTEHLYIYIYIYIYIYSSSKENIFPSSIRFPSTSNRMELERSLVHSTLEKWNKIFEKCRLLRFLLYQYSILSRKTVEEE